MWDGGFSSCTRAAYVGAHPAQHESPSKLTDLLLDGRMEQGNYESNNQRLRTSIGALKAEISQIELDAEAEMEATVAFAGQVVTEAPMLWRQGDLATRQRIQQALLPGGVVYAGGSFRTAETGLFFGGLQAFVVEKERMVDQTGIEPVTS